MIEECLFPVLARLSFFHFFSSFHFPRRAEGELVALSLSFSRSIAIMYMPLEVPLGEFAFAPVNPVHEEVVRRKRELWFSTP